MPEPSTSSDAPPVSSGLARQIRGDLMTLTKARLSFLVVLTSCFGYFVATKEHGGFSWLTLLHLVFGTGLSAAGAAVFNQLMEVEADARMRRTSDRPLPANRLPKPAAFILGWMLAGFGLVHLGVKVNTEASVMAAATLVTYLFLYTPMKRVSTANTLVGAVSGALPPLIGWAAGDPDPGWKTFLEPGAIFLFGLLFFWQLPHFAAINWMYRDEYMRGGFRMWSNDDESGAKTARIALFYAVCLTLLAAVFPFVSTDMSAWGAAPGTFLGGVTALLAAKFLKSGDRSDARRLFFYTLIYLPLMMVASYLAWVARSGPEA
ncbi:MAG: heme o synthase [Verrucomicrobiae bacterium]|nr:heme o synthase [Verrucomicrobiae bacterium]